jgi:hypothetical protein
VGDLALIKLGDCAMRDAINALVNAGWTLVDVEPILNSADERIGSEATLQFDPEGQHMIVIKEYHHV